MNAALKAQGIGEWGGVTSIHPLGLAAVILAGVLMLLLPRKHAVVPVMVIACLVSRAQRWVVLGLDFDLLRIMVLLGWTRLLLRTETKGFKWLPADICILGLAICGTGAYSLLRGTQESLISSLGRSYDLVGSYFLFRCLIRDFEDVRALLKGMVWIAVPVTVAFLVEHFTRRNLFAVFGGLPAITYERGGRLRCQGAFAHPILAGCFWAAWIPMFAAWWFTRRRALRARSAVGLSACGALIVLCSSSTPVMAAIFAGLGWCMYGARIHMRPFRWGVAIGLFLLHMVMKAPVWHLISRVNILSSSTGWHRFHLIDEFINNTADWWALGTDSMWRWGVYDTTNQYVYEGVRGGILTLACFVAVLAFSYRSVGRMWRASERIGTREEVLMSWGMGVVLFVHSMSFLAVSYFGQITTLWLLQLAIIASLDQHLTARRAAASRPGGPSQRLALPGAGRRSVSNRRRARVPVD